mgnify:CR=1 FL=1
MTKRIFPATLLHRRRQQRELVERHLARHREGAEFLWKHLHEPGQFRQRFPGADHQGEYVQCRENAIPGGRVIHEDDVAGLLAADVEVAFPHPFDHVAVADVGHFDPDSGLFHRPVQAEVAHAGHHHRVVGEAAVLFEIDRQHADDSVAVDFVAVGVAEDHAEPVEPHRTAGALRQAAVERVEELNRFRIGVHSRLRPEFQSGPEARLLFRRVGQLSEGVAQFDSGDVELPPFRDGRIVGPEPRQRSPVSRVVAEKGELPPAELRFDLRHHPFVEAVAALRFLVIRPSKRFARRLLWARSRKSIIYWL